MLPNQNVKMSSSSIVREMPNIEIEVEIEDEQEAPEGMHIMPDGTMMADSEHEVEKHGTHNQSTHGRKKTGVPTSALGGQQGGAVDIDGSMQQIDTLLTQAKSASSSDFASKEEPKIREAVNSAYLNGNMKPLRSLNQKYADKRYAIDLKFDDNSATEWDTKNFNAWDGLVQATSVALEAFGEQPDNS